MTTLFDAGTTPWEPVQLELWSHTGTRLGYIGDYEDVKLTFTDRGADTLELTTPLNPVTASLVPCDGTVLIGARYKGRTHLTMPVKGGAASGDNPAQAMVKVTGAGGWSLLDSELIPPSLGAPVHTQTEKEFHLKGPLETVVKSLLWIGRQRTGHPIVITPDQGRGGTVEVSGAWESVSEIVQGLLVKSGWRLEMAGWLPGDSQPEEMYLTTPCVVAEILPYRVKDGLEWSVESGDITDWEISHVRASTTRGTVGYEMDKQEQRRYISVQGEESGSPWAVRDAFVEYTGHKEIDDRSPDPYQVMAGMEATGRDMLAKGAASMSMDVAVDISMLWDFVRRSTSPRTFDIGDWAIVTLPGLGTYKQVITEVTLHATPDKFTITPTVSTPDTLDMDIYSTLARMMRKVEKTERS